MFRRTMFAGWGLIALVSVVVFVGLISYYGGLLGNNVQAHYNKAVINSKVTQAVFNPNNKIQSQGYFEALHADFEGYLTKIKFQPTATAFDKANLLGLRQQCVDAAQQYNSAARSLGQGPFVSADLPFQIDATLCAT